MMLSFVNSVGGNNGGVLLDNISVTATPLPSTWTMLIAGFIGLGFFAYRGSKKSSARSRPPDRNHDNADLRKTA